MSRSLSIFVDLGDLDQVGLLGKSISEVVEIIRSEFLDASSLSDELVNLLVLCGKDLKSRLTKDANLHPFLSFFQINSILLPIRALVSRVFQVSEQISPPWPSELQIRDRITDIGPVLKRLVTKAHLRLIPAQLSQKVNGELLWTH